MLNFDEILGRVDKHVLPTTKGPSQIRPVHPFEVRNNANETCNSVVQAGLENELYRILSSSENLWSRGAAPVQSHLLFGERGIQLPPREIKKPIENIEDDSGVVPAPVIIDDIDADELEEDVARVKVEADRAFFNHMMLSRPAAAPITPAQPFHKETVSSTRGTIVNPRVSDRRELIFGEKLHKYLRSGFKKDLCNLMREAVEESGTDGVLEGVWSDVLSVISRKTVSDRNDVITTAVLLEDACDYLHRLFAEHMQTVVDRNLERAQRGGVPGTRGLVCAFLNIGTDDPNAEDDNIDGLPIWEVTFHCLRAGDVKAAADALTRLQSFPQCAALVSALNHISKYSKLDVDLKKKLKVEWRHNATHIKDKHKRALYAALLGGLESTLSDTLENWLWFKLYPLRVDPQLTPLLYQEVQKAVTIDYGEQYFMANGRSDFQYYFTALWLSGQFERAIHLLHECDQRVDSVHVAVLAHRLGYLQTTESSTDDMMVIDPSEPTKCRINLARLLVSYTKSFELIDVPRALDYWFLLQGVTTPTGSDVFEMAVSRSVYLTGHVDIILGHLNDDGRREKGLIDEYLDEPSAVISRVAHDTELSGEWTAAVGLYLLAGKPTHAAKLLSSEISEVLRTDDVQRSAELVNVADEFKRVQRGCQSSEYATLSMLVDLCSLFEHCRHEEADRVYQIIKSLRLLPTEPDQVAVLVNEFHMVPQKVREVLPDACLHVMKCLVDACIRHSTSSERRSTSSDISIFSSSNQYVKLVKAIVLYAASVPYKFPTHITSKLLQLQASLGV